MANNALIRFKRFQRDIRTMSLQELKNIRYPMLQAKAVNDLPSEEWKYLTELELVIREVQTR